MLQVAFSAFTDFGAVMALAIAVHNIPEVGPPKASVRSCLGLGGSNTCSVPCKSILAQSAHLICLLPCFIHPTAVQIMHYILSASPLNSCRASSWQRLCLQPQAAGGKPWALQLPRYVSSAA